MLYLALILPALGKLTYSVILLLLIFFTYKIIRAISSNLPGPFLGKLTNLYGGYFFFNGQLHILLHKLHLKYGPVVQFAPNAVSVISKEDINQLYGTYKYVRSPLYSAFRIGGNSLAHLPRKDEHFNRKKVIKKVFSSKNLPEIESLINISGMIPFSNKLTEISKENANCDFNNLIHLVYLDIIGMIGFGKYLNAVNTPKYNIIKSLKQAMVYSLMTYIFPITEIIGDLIGKKGHLAVIKFCEEITKEANKENHGKNPLSVLHALQDSKDFNSGEYISDSDIQAEMLLQLLAGIDTTTDTVIWAVKKLLDDAKIMSRIVSELDAAFPTLSCEITADTVKKNCPYLEAVIFETMRMFSPTVSFVPRVVPQEGAYFSGHYLEPGMECSYASFAYHRSPLHWVNPEVFDPERFMGPEGIKERSKVLVFILGPTGCPGRELALMALFLTLANLLRKFKISTDNLNLSIAYSSFMINKPESSSFPVKVSIRDN